MTSPRKTVLPAAVTAAVLAFTTFLPAVASDDPHQNLNPRKGDVVSVETKELATVAEDPELPAAPPRTGDKNPGATMGQKMKSMAETTKLSAASEKELAKVESTVLGDDAASPSPAPSGTASGKATPGSSESASAQAAAPNGVGPAGSMSLVIRAGTWRPAGIAGMDVSGWQAAVNWSAEYANGARFAYVKATEGIGYRSEAFNDQYTGSYAVGMNRGAYHFALPSQTTGAEQADFFVNSGGGWSADGRTLPGLLDIEYNPYASLGDTCYNMSAAQMNAWIRSFSDRYKERTGRLPAIYTTTDWWSTCTGNTSQFNNQPLHLASYSTVTPTWMPNGWTGYDLWQFSDNGPFSGDSNVYAGSWAQFQSLASSANYNPLGGRPNGYTVSGGIGTVYRATGGEARWGSPVSGERAAGYGGRYQQFSRAGVLSTAYWHPSTGGHMLANRGAIGQKFLGAGSEYGYGFPSTEERTITGGAYQVFRPTNGRTTKVMWTSGTGAHAIKEQGAIGKRWAQGGQERGMGFPTTDEYRSGNEIRQQFSKGYMIGYNTTTGAVRVVRG
ncbi:GH25 family lysozyme [Kocuria sp.]|uniref:GH25 family lysozyme n=1 Tax=Kocuria sp. TaxID=1871328 RepID=UPI0026DD7E3A|nr:GH25 family lysozyme [Kocuria sp.]MDO4919633.1 GH25 family lysozyme [Kocuria sp.]